MLKKKSPLPVNSKYTHHNLICLHYTEVRAIREAGSLKEMSGLQTARFAASFKTRYRNFSNDLRLPECTPGIGLNHKLSTCNFNLPPRNR